MRTRPQCSSVANVARRIMQRGTHGVWLVSLVAALLGQASAARAQNVTMPPAEAPAMDVGGGAPVTDYGAVNFFSQDLGTVLRLRYNTESYGQDQRGNFDIGSMQVFTFDDTAAILDGQVTMNEVNGVGFNVGAGYRWMDFPFYAADTGRVEGVGIFADGTHTDAGNFFPQIGVSVESLGELWDVRGNMYIPLGPQDKIGNFEPTGVLGFSGNSISQLTRAVVDSSYTVGEVEIARRLGAERDAWAFAGPYFVTNDNDDAAGYRIGVRGYAFPDLLLQVAVSDDEIFKTNASFQVQWFVGRTRSNFTPAGGVPDRMREPFMRNDYVALSKSTVAGAGTALRNTDGTNIRVVHVDSNAAAGGNGTAEHPYNELAQANSGGSQMGDIILAHAESTFTSNLILQNNQRLLGEGNNFNNTVTTLEEGTISLPASSPGAISRTRPIIATAMGDAVTLAVSNEVANLDFNGSMDRAIAAPTVGAGNPNIHDLTISNTTGDAIFFAPTTVTDPSNGANLIVRGNATIRNVTLDNIGGSGVHINSYTPTDVTQSNVTLQEVIALSNISSSDGTGPALNLENTHSGTGRTTTVTNFNYDGGFSSQGGIRLNNFDGTFTASNSRLTNGALTSNGVNIVGDTDGTINFQSTVNFDSLDGTAFNVDGDVGGTDSIGGTITVASAINNDTNRSVSVRNLATGASVSFNGNITDTGTGVLVADNTAGNVTFVGDLAMTIDTAAATAVAVTGNAAATNIDFAGDVNITATDTANGFVATGGGTISAPGTVNTISVASGQALKITDMNIASASVRFGDINRTVAAASSAIQLENNTSTGSGSIVVGNTTDNVGDAGTIEAGNGNAILVKDTANASITGLIVNKTGTGAGVRVEKTSTATQTTNLSDLRVSGGEEGINTVGGGTGGLTMTVNDTTVQNQTSIGMHFNNVDVTTTPIQVNNTTVDGDPTIAAARGVVVEGSNGSITFNNAVQIKEWGSTDFEVSGITTTPTPGTISFAGDIINSSAANAQDTTGRSVHIHNNAAGTVTFTSESSIDDRNQGMLVAQNTGGTFTFSGDNNFNTGTNDAVTLDTNTGASISIGDLAITTSSGRGFVATGGGALTVSGFANTITRTAGGVSGAALDIENMTIGAVDFESVNATGGQNGIRLVDNLNGATPGSITIGDTGNTAGQGGTITGTADQGVFARNSNVTLNGVTVTNAGNAANENAVEITHTNATAMNANLNRLTVTNATAARDGVVIDGTGGSGTFNANVQNLNVNVTGDGFVATNGVTLTAGGTNTITSGTGVGLSLSNVAISNTGANFQSVNVTAGATNAINLTNVTGGQIAVTGTGTTDASGGTLTTTGDAIVLNNVTNVDLNNVRVASSGGQAVNVDHTAGATGAMDVTLQNLEVVSSTGNGINVLSANNSNAFNLRLNSSTSNESVVMSHTGSGAFGLLVDGTDVTTTGTDVAFSLAFSGSAQDGDVTIRNNSSFQADDASAFSLTGTSTNVDVELALNNASFMNNSNTARTASIVINGGATLNANVENNTFSNSGSADEYYTESNGSTSRVNLNLDNNTSTGVYHLFTANQGTPTVDFNFGVVDRDNADANNAGTVTFDPAINQFEDITGPVQSPTVP
ncbi:MAG: hypothetical protein U0805_01535 [Pirellulales bacterium]